MQKEGFCPTQQKDYSIDVFYKEVSNTKEKRFVKNGSQCEYDLFGDKCHIDDCPIYESAPEYIRQRI